MHRWASRWFLKRTYPSPVGSAVKWSLISKRSSTSPNPSKYSTSCCLSMSWSGRFFTYSSASSGPGSGSVGLRLIGSWSTKNEDRKEPSDQPRGCHWRHSTMHSSTRSPSPTLVWCRLATAFSMAASFRSFTYPSRVTGASGPSPGSRSSSRLTEARPPNGAKMNRSPFSDQDAGKPRSTRLPLTSATYASCSLARSPERWPLHSSTCVGDSHTSVKWARPPAKPPIVRPCDLVARQISWKRPPPWPPRRRQMSRP
mmetsp:Transcript_62249/g.167877  ORF Transcript_62249/g.167877 Transcript_62249/m.167877 type:complete len:256 (+) Transcript_62249:494-1261(+)